MSEIKALDKLRDAWQGIGGETSCAGCYYKIEDYIDEIEAEIAERYMLLPMDADGVPIHIGDAMQCIHDGSVRVVGFISKNGFIERKLTYYYPDCFVHPKPRTLKDVLAEFGIAAARELNADPDGYGISDKTIAECASKIRELLCGDAE